MGGLLAPAFCALVWRWWEALGNPSAFQDADVYRRASLDILHGLDPYAPGHPGLLYTYPPFGAIFLVPLGLAPRGVANGLLTTCSLAALTVVVLVVRRELNLARRQFFGVVLFAVAAEPVVRTVQQGQVNLMLAALLVLDAFVVPAKYRGLLTGVAAGVKIIPGVMVLYFLLRRDWGAVLRVVVGATSTLLVSIMVAPVAARHYWLQLLFDTSRSGGGRYPDNQSITGVVARLLQNDHPPTLVVLPLQVAALAFAAWTANRAVEGGRPAMEPFVALALGGLLASPVSWSHHWVWAIPCLAYLLVTEARVPAVTFAVIFLFEPLWLSPLGVLGPQRWSFWLNLPLMLMPLAGIFVLARLWRNSSHNSLMKDAGGTLRARAPGGTAATTPTATLSGTSAVKASAPPSAAEPVATARMAP